MYASAFMAFLHHLAAFALVGALVAEVVLFKPPLTAQQALRVLRTDTLFGVAAGLLLAIGLLRVFYFEKGPLYYFSDVFFIAKLTLFILASLISVYPTMLFLSWRQTLKKGGMPEIDPARARRARMCMMLELTAIVAILLCAPFMARGIGQLR